MTTAQQDSPAQEQAPKHVNRLSRESSPYLLQHQHNPVDWYPWGSEAFEAARTQDKPIFLSIGYSTCYWCHVMERESFESEQIAAIMNEHFICIKVDREERPDVDDIYMAAVQMTTGHGGWPMSVFLEPQSLKPFFAGTYFPPGDSFGRPGFPSILRQLARAWESQREAVMKQADQIAAAVTEHLSKLSEPASISKREVDQAISELLGSYDAKDGGFVSPGQRAPKFPTPVNLDFLMGAAWDVKQARDATIHTLDRMIMGGMYDQVGGGFHRYSVDEKWLVPHFEKMLYDNGQLASTYARAFELTKDAYYAEALRETLDYVLREMTSASGAFYSAQDAEVNGQEGANYIWTADEVRDALNAENLEAHVDLALEVYGLSQGTNFQDPHHPELQPKNVLFLIDRPNKIAARRGIALNEFNAQLETIHSALLKARMKREQPRLDDKILASWNGTMIAGFADGGRVLNEKKYKDAAIRAADFVLRTMRDSDGGLLRSYRGDSAAKIDGFLEDYAMMIRGLIAVHRATNDRRMLEEAKRLTQIARVKFWDQTSVGGASGGGGGGGGYFDTLEGQSDLFVRVKSSYDGAIPSGNSVMLHNLLDLHELTAQTTYLDDAAATLKALSGNISKHPTASILATLALHRMISKYPQRLGAAVTVAMPGTSSLPRSTQPVQISLEPVEVHVKPGSPATFTVKIVIAKPFHINSSNPGEDFLIPLSIKLAGCEGLKLTPEYPKGDAYKSEFADGTIYVHSGTIAVPVRLEQTGTFTGTPRLSITYQTCTDKECLEPKTEMLGLRIIAQR